MARVKSRKGVGGRGDGRGGWCVRKLLVGWEREYDERAWVSQSRAFDANLEDTHDEYESDEEFDERN